MVEIMNPDFIFNDDRGSLTQLVHDGWKQINVIFSKRNCVRGRHFHKQNREAFYVISGKLELNVKDSDSHEEAFVFSSNDMFAISPNVIHSFNFLEDTWLVSMYSNGVELGEGKKDIYSE